MRHADISGAQAVHQSAYVQVTDPGAVGALKAWIDTSTDPAQHKVRNVTNDGWILVGVAGRAGHVIQDEGVAQPQRTNLNFTGAGVAISDDDLNDQTDISIGGDLLSITARELGAVLTTSSTTASKIGTLAATITTTGGKVMVSFKLVVRKTGTNANAGVAVRRNGTEMGTEYIIPSTDTAFNYKMASIVDEPPVGTHTYEFFWNVENINDSLSTVSDVDTRFERYISATELRL